MHFIHNYTQMLFLVAEHSLVMNPVNCYPQGKQQFETAGVKFALTSVCWSQKMERKPVFK